MPPVQTVILDIGGPVRVLDYGGSGHSSPVVCVHGLGGSATNWHALAPLLTPQHRVVAFDLPGHGATRVGSGPAMSDATHVLDEVVRWLADGGRVSVVAHSFGGTSAIQWASGAPQRVDRLALLAPPVPHAPGYDVRIALKQLLLSTPGVRQLVHKKVESLSPEAAVRQQIEQATPHPEQVAPAVVAAAVEEVQARRRDGVEGAQLRRQWQMILETMTLLRRGASYAGSIAALDVPGLWVNGSDDPLSLPASARRFAALQPAWTFHEVAGAGHLTHAERPDAVAAILTST